MAGSRLIWLAKIFLYITGVVGDTNSFGYNRFWYTSNSFDNELFYTGRAVMFVLCPLVEELDVFGSPIRI